METLLGQPSDLEFDTFLKSLPNELELHSSDLDLQGLLNNGSSSSDDDVVNATLPDQYGHVAQQNQTYYVNSESKNVLFTNYQQPSISSAYIGNESYGSSSSNPSSPNTQSAFQISSSSNNSSAPSSPIVDMNNIQRIYNVDNSSTAIETPFTSSSGFGYGNVGAPAFTQSNYSSPISSPITNNYGSSSDSDYGFVETNQRNLLSQNQTIPPSNPSSANSQYPYLFAMDNQLHSSPSKKRRNVNPTAKPNSTSIPIAPASAPSRVSISSSFTSPASTPLNITTTAYDEQVLRLIQWNQREIESELGDTGDENYSNSGGAVGKQVSGKRRRETLGQGNKESQQEKHKFAEKKRRNDMNELLDKLKSIVPVSVRDPSSFPASTNASTFKPTKIQILQDTVEYVTRLHSLCVQLISQNSSLQAQLVATQSSSSSIAISDSTSTTRKRHASADSSSNSPHFNSTMNTHSSVPNVSNNKDRLLKQAPKAMQAIFVSFSFVYLHISFT